MSAVSRYGATTLTGMTCGPRMTPALWITASNGPRRFTWAATSRVSSRSDRFPMTASAPRSSRSRTAGRRFVLRAWTTTSWPSSISVCAAARPRPSAEPVMNTRVMSLLGVSRPGAGRTAAQGPAHRSLRPAAPPAEVSGLGADELPDGVARRRRQVLGEELLQLVERDQVGLVVEVDVAGARDDVELLRLCRALVGVLAVVPRVRVFSRDEQDRPRRDPLDLREQREIHERQAARRRELGDRVRVIAARRGVELAGLAGDRVGALVESDRRVSRGQNRRAALEVRIALLRARVEEVVALLFGERVTEALDVQAVVVVHDDGRDRLEAPVDLRRAEAEGAAAAHADHTDALPAHERSRAQVVHGRAEVLDEDV